MTKFVEVAYHIKITVLENLLEIRIIHSLMIY